ncbi:MAG: aminotransferase class V-fold PLP-dependent enzyme [Pirellula sp.]
MPASQRIYLDHAATSWPKMPGVVEACVAFQRQIGASAGRGVYRSAASAERIVESTRKALASLIGAQHPGQIAFTSNGTMALYVAILGVLHANDLRDQHVVTTTTEHNSVLRMLAKLEDERGLSWTAVPCDHHGRVAIDALRGAMRPNTQLVIVNHASNVTGVVQDIATIGQAAHANHALLLVDAAQSIGYVEIDAARQPFDLLVAPGHKGLGGMLGTAFIYSADSVRDRLRCPWIGGTGRQSDRLRDAFSWTESVESGNLNVPAVASLEASLKQLPSCADFASEWTPKLATIIDALSGVPGLRVLATSDPSIPNEPLAPVISLTSDMFGCHELAMLLDQEFGIEARSGYHCTALMHRDLGTETHGGTLRISFGHTSTQHDFDAAIEAMNWLRKLHTA